MPETPTTPRRKRASAIVQDRLNVVEQELAIKRIELARLEAIKDELCEVLGKVKASPSADDPGGAE